MKENFNVKGKNGAIAIFVLVGLLFMTSFLIISYGYNVNKSKTAKEQFNIISDIYSHKDGDANAYERAYTALRKQNKQTLTASAEDTSTLELEKTYAENLVNYKIYGNGKNLFDINSITKFYVDGTEMDITLNYSSISDGILTNNRGYYSKAILCNSNITKLKAGTYTISADVISDRTDGNKEIYFRIWDTNDVKYGTTKVLSSYQTWEKVTCSFSLTKDIEVKGFQFQGTGEAGDYTELNIKFKNIQLEEGSVATEYKPYEYGVGDKVENLFDADDIVNKNSATVSRIEFNGEKCITWSQKNTVSTQRMLEGKFKENTIYYAKGSIALSLNMGKNPLLFTVVYTDGSSEYITGKTIENSMWNPGEFKECLLTMGDESKTISYIQGIHSNSESIYIKESTFQIIEKDFSWIDKYIEDEEYIIKVEAKGKNLVNIPDMNIKYTGFFQDYFPQNPMLVLKPNTQYTVSFDYIINLATTKILCGIGYGTDMYSKDIVWGQDYPNQTKGRFKYTFTTPSTFNTSLPYLQFRFVRGNESGTFDVDISNLQVEFGDKATEYEEFQGSFETTIYLDSPLKDGEYIDFKTSKVVRVDGTEEHIDLPELLAYEDYTKIEVLTEVAPSKIEVEYVGYTLE